MPNWEMIVRTHGPPAFDTAWRLLGNAADAEEVVQDALLAAYEMQERGIVDNWGGLLRHLATRRSIDRLRKRRETATLNCEPRSRDPEPEAAAIERELAEQLRQAVAQLSDREAGVFSLRYFGEMTNSEIAQTLGITIDAVGVALHKARTRLKQLLRVDREALEEYRNSTTSESRKRHE